LIRIFYLRLFFSYYNKERKKSQLFSKGIKQKQYYVLKRKREKIQSFTAYLFSTENKIFIVFIASLLYEVWLKLQVN